jgi:hypothetical protein
MTQETLPTDWRSCERMRRELAQLRLPEPWRVAAA